jgi:DNA-binding NarL/FixJ family response regulator
LRKRRGRKTKRGQSPHPAVRADTVERSEDSQTKIPTTVHEGGVLSWMFSKKAREKYLGQRVSGRDRQADLDKLTKTERRVYPMLEDVLTNKEIAEKLGVSEETAKTHVHNILTKLHLKNRSKLVKS